LLRFFEGAFDGEARHNLGSRALFAEQSETNGKQG